jgi:hypothetical protein
MPERNQIGVIAASSMEKQHRGCTYVTSSRPV